MEEYYVEVDVCHTDIFVAAIAANDADDNDVTLSLLLTDLMGVNCTEMENVWTATPQQTEQSCALLDDTHSGAKVVIFYTALEVLCRFM